MAATNEVAADRWEITVWVSNDGPEDPPGTYESSDLDCVVLYVQSGKKEALTLYRADREILSDSFII
jgi:hypothetical protein